jgi:L-malate glycosyltransferase
LAPLPKGLAKVGLETMSSVDKTIVHVVTTMHWRGGENQLATLLNVAQSLKSSYRQIVVLQPEAPFADRFPIETTIVRCPMHNDLDLRSAWRIAHVCGQYTNVILHAHTAKAHGIALLAKKWISLRYPRAAIKLIVHRRVEPNQKIRWLQKRKYVSASVDRYICVSKAIAKGLEGLGIATEKIRVVYSSVACHEVPHALEHRRALRRSLDINDSTPLVLFAGHLEKLKGILELLEAWKIQQKKYQGRPTQPHLCILGEGPLMDQCREASKADATIHVLGFVNNVKDYLCAADIVTLPTHWEGLGSILLDAAIQGCALVATQVGGVPEIVQDRKTGLLVAAKNPAQLAEALMFAMDRADLRKVWVEAARQHVKLNFNEEKMAKETLAIYDDLTR